jgi:hypothetical protein
VFPVLVRQVHGFFNSEEAADTDESLPLFSTFPVVRSISRNDAKHSPFLIPFRSASLNCGPSNGAAFFLCGAGLEIAHAGTGETNRAEPLTAHQTTTTDDIRSLN